MYNPVTKSRTIKYLLIIDTIIVFLNLSTSYSLFPYLVFRSYNRFVNLIALQTVNLFYCFFRFKRLYLVPAKHSLLYLYILLNVSCFLGACVSDTPWSAVLAYAISNVFFYFILYNQFISYRRIYTFQRSLWLILRGYLILAAFSVISCTVMFLFIKAGLSPYNNPINTRYDLFLDNYANLGANYYFPYHFCIVSEPRVGPVDVRIPFFSSGGAVRGFYHEPHTLTFMVFPALFMALYWVKAKWGKFIIIILYILIALLASSGTNVVATLISITIAFLFFIKKNPKAFVISTIGVFALGAVLFSIFRSFDLELFLAAKSGSTGYSESMVYFATHPKTLFGSSFYSTVYVDYSNPESINVDVGYISFVLNIIFLLICIVKIGKLFIRRDSLSESIMLASVYFFCHSTKVAMVSYSLSMLVFLCFLLTVFTESKSKYDSILLKENIS